MYLIDGTWLWPGSGSSVDVYSNIYRMNLLLNPEANDGAAVITHYTRGLGGVDGPRKYTSGGFAYGIDELIADIYINICSNYERGDKIYLFGFSRGAVVARALSGLISKGILSDDHINKFKHVWGSYVGSKTVQTPGFHDRRGRASKERLMRFSELCSETEPTIEFLGVFDTVVGGHGLAEVAQRLRLRECRVEPNVRSAVHLLALDETRNFFKPVFWTDQERPQKVSGRPDRHIEQIWMPGVHADVGGAYSSRFLGDVSLITMIDRVMATTELRFNTRTWKRYNQELREGELAFIHDEHTGLWRYAKFRSKPRTLNDSILQSVHPYVLKLDGSFVNYKNSKDILPYHVRPDIAALTVSPEFLSDGFQSMLS